MESGYSIKRENPKSRANPISKLFFLWMVKLCYKGARNGLQIVDLYKVLSEDRSDILTNTLEKHWNEEIAKTEKKSDYVPNLTRAIFKTFFWKYMVFGCLLFIQAIFIRSFQPTVLAYFISLFGDVPLESYAEMYISASILVLQSLIGVFFMHHCEFGQAMIGMRVRVSVSSLVYRKLLKLDQKSIGQTAAGQIVNLLSNDVNRFDLVAAALHYFWIMPFQVVLVTFLIWREVGVSSLAGVLSMVLLTIPVQSYLGTLASSLRVKVATRTDQRVRLMNEVIQGIQVIKMYAWEKPFEAIIKLVRKKEVKVLTHSSYLRGIFLSCMVFVERATLYLTLVCYVLLGNRITADKVFSMAQFYNILQLAMAILYPMAITFSAEALVSIQRLEKFLALQEKPPSVIDQSSRSDDIILKDIQASWTPRVKTLNNFELFIPQGILCAVVGPVGAGKSSLLQLLLGELLPEGGSVSLGGAISYCSQEPWLFGSDVRTNILFGQEYDRMLYKKVVKVCALEKDFQQLSHGDRTLVGERGASLSGGQRARINLARAVYRSSDIYLLDDPLSAVDAHVGKHLFEECFVKYLEGKTRILVTHQLQYLKKADLIVVVNEGKIESKGTFQELVHTNFDFTKLLVAADETEDKETEKELISKRKQSILSRTSTITEANSDFPEVEDEAMGLEGSSPLWDYVKASGNVCTIGCVIFILVLGQAACSSCDYWVTFWTQQEFLRNTTQPLEIILMDDTSNSSKVEYFFTEEILVDGIPRTLLKTEMAIYIYSALIVLLIFITLVRSFTFFKMAMIASKNLHNTMFHSLLRAPMRFFDTNPSGRILNRFSKDMGAIDEFLPRVLIDAIQILLVTCGIITMVLLVNPYMAIAIIIVGILFFKVRKWYVSTAKDVKHLEGVTKSPIFSHVNSSLNGLTTIRASGAESSLQRQFDYHQDNHTSTWFLTIATRECFGLWLDLLSVMFTAVVIYSFIILHQYGAVSGSMVGLAISQSLILTGMLQFGMKQTAEVVNQLTSVERIMQYSNLDPEDKLEASPVKTLDPQWPSKGVVEFKDVSLRYSPLEAPVLQHLNLVIKSGSKIGIVGRTGAGKSSLISALFRLAVLEGTIEIDGVDTKVLKLQDLRRRIAIIPQEPVLFSSTLRYNLDPFGEFDDGRLWSVLEEVELKEGVPSLDLEVSERGANFSVGQRQLVCLARAILRNNKVLVLDEATANVDPRTDALIQSTIRRKFHSCTVLTVAHRLNTIMDSDLVLVMEAGRVVQYDHPHILLQDLEGIFASMVAQTGPTMMEQLKNIAHEAYFAKENQ